MPIYEYDCADCGKRFERLSKTAKDVPAKCPFCGGAKLRKAFSAFSTAKASNHQPSSACSSCTSSGCPHSRH